MLYGINMRDGKPAIADEVRMEVLNLHDVFITANMCRDLMEKTPMETLPAEDVHKWTVTRRFRLERLWWALLYVLVEAWEARSNECRAFFDGVDGAAEIDEVLETLRETGVLEKLRKCRHYMFHRDKREYWDDGRMAPFGHLQRVLDVQHRFSFAFLRAIEAFGAARRSEQEQR